VPLKKKKSLLRYLPLILELLELLIAPFKSFPVIMKRRGPKEKEKNNNTRNYLKKSHMNLSLCFQKNLLAKKSSTLAPTTWKTLPSVSMKTKSLKEPRNLKHTRIISLALT